MKTQGVSYRIVSCLMKAVRLRSDMACGSKAVLFWGTGQQVRWLAQPRVLFWKTPTAARGGSREWRLYRTLHRIPHPLHQFPKFDYYAAKNSNNGAENGPTGTRLVDIFPKTYNLMLAALR